MAEFFIRPTTPEDHAWVCSWLEQHWGAAQIVSRGKLHQADRLPAFCAIWQADAVGCSEAGQPVGLITYTIVGGECEIVSLDSAAAGHGIGSSLVAAVQQTAASQGCRRLWLVTTNDNTYALHFYQRQGFTLAALHKNALVESRRLKPSIPLIGIGQIPIRDEIELELCFERSELHDCH